MRQAREWCQAKKIPYYETSAKQAVNVDGAFLCIAGRGLERAQDDLGKMGVDQMANIRLDAGNTGRGNKKPKKSFC